MSVKDKVFEVLLYFITHEDEEVQLKALAGLGNKFNLSNHMICIVIIAHIILAMDKLLLNISYYISFKKTV